MARFFPRFIKFIHENGPQEDKYKPLRQFITKYTKEYNEGSPTKKNLMYSSQQLDMKMQQLGIQAFNENGRKKYEAQTVQKLKNLTLLEFRFLYFYVWTLLVLQNLGSWDFVFWLLNLETVKNELDKKNNTRATSILQEFGLPKSVLPWIGDVPLFLMEQLITEGKLNIRLSQDRLKNATFSQHHRTLIFQLLSYYKKDLAYLQNHISASEFGELTSIEKEKKQKVEKQRLVDSKLKLSRPYLKWLVLWETFLSNFSKRKSHKSLNKELDQLIKEYWNLPKGKATLYEKLRGYTPWLHEQQRNYVKEKMFQEKK